VFSLVCAERDSKDECTVWRDRIAENATIIGNDLGSGARFNFSYTCGTDPVGHPWIDSSTGYADAKIVGKQCLQVVLTKVGGEPLSPHYEPQPDLKGLLDKLLNGGTAAEIALAVVIVAAVAGVFVLQKTGKLKIEFAGFDAGPDP
jgi:hypothetical protein